MALVSVTWISTRNLFLFWLISDWVGEVFPSIPWSVITSHFIFFNMTDVDELFDLKNAFYTGNYSQCIKEAQKMKIIFWSSIILPNTVLYKSNFCPMKSDNCNQSGIQNPSIWGVYRKIPRHSFWDMATLTCFFWQPWKIKFRF